MSSPRTSFIIPFIPRQPQTNSPHLRAKCHLSPTGSSSALDDISQPVKLNAVAEALARRHDYQATLRVLRELSSAGHPLDPQALATIIDSAITAPTALAALLTEAAPTGYSSQTIQPNIQTSQTPIDPARPADLSLATSFLVVVSGAVSAELLEPTLAHHPAPEATSVLLLLFAGLLFDRYAASAVTWRRISAGLARIFADDPVRSARVDAAHFLLAYLLGLPWLCFRPDPRQIIKFHSQRDGLAAEPAFRDGVDAIVDGEVDKYLVWLVAGVAFEDAFDGTLIESSLGGARRFLQKVNRTRRQGSAAIRNESPYKRGEARIRSAIVAAKELLQRHDAIHGEVTDRMLKGASVGECVAVVANGFN